MKTEEEIKERIKTICAGIQQSEDMKSFDSRLERNYRAQKHGQREALEWVLEDSE